MVLHPRYFGPQIRDVIREKLYRDVEGTCLGNYGYVITITCIDEIGAGVLYSEDGMARYVIRYKAIVFRPFKGEVLEAIVKQVNKIGIFVEIGAVTCFINRHSIPSHYQFHAGLPACYKSEGDEAAISVEEKIRVKVIGVRMDMSGLFTIGGFTLKLILD
jgi:DNA-directed RNA polymerase II subunit RPB7